MTYGVSTGFGSLANVVIPADRRVELQAHAERDAERHRRGVTQAGIGSLDPDNPEATSLLGGPDQRRQMTLMFCDLVGSTALADGMDPEELGAILREYRTTCSAVIERYGGFVEDCLGDGVLVRFGYPWVHEDDARRSTSGARGWRSRSARPSG